MRVPELKKSAKHARGDKLLDPMHLSCCHYETMG
jgi:hypothetical protein